MKETHAKNDWYWKRRRELVVRFGGKCRYCSTPDVSVSDSVLAKKLEFCHKVNERISGMGRGRNARIAEVARDPKRFWLGCRSCHTKYDIDHPLTDAEIKAIDEEVPF